TVRRSGPDSRDLAQAPRPRSTQASERSSAPPRFRRPQRRLGGEGRGYSPREDLPEQVPRTICPVIVERRRVEEEVTLVFALHRLEDLALVLEVDGVSVALEDDLPLVDARRCSRKAERRVSPFVEVQRDE